MRTWMVAVLAGAGLLAGCGGITGESPPDPASGPRLAPPVADPRPVGNFPACDLLTREQKLALELDLESQALIDDDPLGCTTKFADGQGRLGFSVRLPPIGLESAYLVRSAFEVFEPGEVAGYPVVKAQPAAFAELDQTCFIQLGIADEQMIDVRVIGVDSGTGCATARRAAEQVVANLPPPR